MNLSSQAADQLKTIRGLLERATVYRAISVPGAAACGVVSAFTAALAWQAEPRVWQASWLSALALVAAANTGILWRQARREQRPFVSSGFRLALRGLLPPLVAGGVCGLLWIDEPLRAGPLWALFYGLALLATREFAPRSLVWLGQVFFLTGLAALVVQPLLLARFPEAGPSLASLFMALSFGGFHLVYAAGVGIAARRPASAQV